MLPPDLDAMVLHLPAADPGELRDRPSAGGAGFVLVAAPARRRARCGVVTGKSFRRGAGLTR